MPILDLKYSVGLNHLPCRSSFPANGAWLEVQGHRIYNLARWTARIGLGEQLVTTRDP